MPGIVQLRLSQDSPLYFPLVAGLICLYGKPFKRSEGIGKLPIEMVPKEYLDLHTDLITIRDKLYAHSDSDKTVTLGGLHFGELRAYRYKYQRLKEATSSIVFTSRQGSSLMS